MTPAVWYLYASAAYLFDHLENQDAIEKSAGSLANSDVQSCVAWMNSKPGPNCGQVSGPSINGTLAAQAHSMIAFSF
jgi:hypothetical protein